MYIFRGFYPVLKYYTIEKNGCKVVQMYKLHAFWQGLLINCTNVHCSRTEKCRNISSGGLHAALLKIRLAATPAV